MFSMEYVYQEIYEELYCIGAQHHPHEEEVGWLRVQKREYPLKKAFEFIDLIFPSCNRFLTDFFPT